MHWIELMFKWEKNSSFVAKAMKNNPQFIPHICQLFTIKPHYTASRDVSKYFPLTVLTVSYEPTWFFSDWDIASPPSVSLTTKSERFGLANAEKLLMSPSFPTRKSGFCTGTAYLHLSLGCGQRAQRKAKKKKKSTFITARLCPKPHYSLPH